MCQNFTDRARKAMQLANEEALRFNHEYIGTEHILLGLIKEPTGIAHLVLKGLGVDLRKARVEIEKVVQPGSDCAKTEKLPYTPRAQKVLEYALEEKRRLNRNYVDTEHLLLGLVREHDGVGAQVLISCGLLLEILQETVAQALELREERNAQALNAATNFSIRIEVCRLLLRFDQTIDTLDTAVFQAAHHDELESADTQRDRAMSEKFHPPVKGQRDSILGMRNVTAEILGFNPRKAHDLSPRDYHATPTGYLVRRSS